MGRDIARKALPAELNFLFIFVFVREVFFQTILTIFIVIYSYSSLTASAFTAYYSLTHTHSVINPFPCT